MKIRPFLRTHEDGLGWFDRWQSMIFTASDPGPASRIRIVATLAGFSSDDPGDHNGWLQSGNRYPLTFVCT